MSQGSIPADGDGIAVAERPRLAMRHITKSFGGVRALRDVSFVAQAGEVVEDLGKQIRK